MLNPARLVPSMLTSSVTKMGAEAAEAGRGNEKKFWRGLWPRRS